MLLVAEEKKEKKEEEKEEEKEKEEEEEAVLSPPAYAVSRPHWQRPPPVSSSPEPAVHNIFSPSRAGDQKLSRHPTKSLPTKSSNPEFLQNPPQICRRYAKFLPAYQNCPRLCRHATEILPGFKDQ